MRVITLARKPLIGSVADNVLRHGTGGLNIDASRVGTDEKLQAGAAMPGANFDDDDYQWKGACNPQHPAGRWPPNVILEHRPECRCVGSREVKGRDATRSGNQPGEGGQFGTDIYGDSKGRGEATPRGYAGADGKESVAVWDCHPECPIQVLDEQSGVCPTGLGGITRKNDNSPVYVGPASSQDRMTIGYGDTGGASRFFKQTQGES